MSTRKQSRKQEQILWISVGLAAAAAISVLWIRFIRSRLKRIPKSAEKHPLPVSGLSDREAESRRQEGQDNVIDFMPPRSRQKIIQENTFTVFNISLIGVAVVQFALGLLWEGFISLGVAALNVGINVFQELLAKRMLENAVRATRPKATVIRESIAKSIDPSRIVHGDALVIGPGDQILADGEIITTKPIHVNESMLNSEDRRAVKRLGDKVFAGSYCLSGRAAYEAQHVGDDRLITKLTAKLPAQAAEKTQLEKIVQQVLTVMLIIVSFFMIILLSFYTHLDDAVGVDASKLVSAAGVIFSLAPAGMYFMIFLNYLSGTAKLARQGALVHQARSLETLAHTSILCLPPTITGSALNVEVEEIEPDLEDGRPSGSRLRGILSEFSHSISSRDQAVTVLADAFPGQARPITAELPFLAVFGWAAAAFDDDDLRGVFVLAEPELIEANLVLETAGKQHNQNRQIKIQEKPSLRDRMNNLGDLFQRLKLPTKKETKSMVLSETSGDEIVPQNLPGLEITKSAWNQVGVPNHKDLESAPLLENQVKKNTEPDTQNKNQFHTLFDRLHKVIKLRKEGERQESETGVENQQQKPENKLVYLFAYLPEPSALYDDSGQPLLPHNLIPLCRLNYYREIKSDTIETVRNFIRTGVSLKLFTSRTPDRIIALLKHIDLDKRSDINETVVYHQQLIEADKNELMRLAGEKIIFVGLTTEQTHKVIDSLHQQGETIAVYGDNPADLPFMKQADLSISVKNASQAALSTANIVLLDRAPKVLENLLEEGQKTVNGLLEVLKLYLTQLAYLTFLIVILWVGGLGFPYLSQQGAFISITTLALPSLALSLTAHPGTLSKIKFSRLLSWFVIPAALAICSAGFAVYIHFLKANDTLAYAQLALTHMLVFSGLALVILVRLPTRRQTSEGGNKPDMIKAKNPIGRMQELDWRMTFIVLILLVLYLGFTTLPIASRFFSLTHLQSINDYLFVLGFVLLWITAVTIFWQFFTPKPYKPWTLHNGPFSDRVQKMDQRSY